jgi:hypothetical protein
MKTIKQGSLLFPKIPVSFGGTNGRMVNLACGQSVWVANSQLDQQNTGIVKLARSGRNAGAAWNFDAADVEKHFTLPIY